jgi:hypothetical protein
MNAIFELLVLTLVGGMVGISKKSAKPGGGASAN